MSKFRCSRLLDSSGFSLDSSSWIQSDGRPQTGNHCYIYRECTVYWTPLCNKTTIKLSACQVKDYCTSTICYSFQKKQRKETRSSYQSLVGTTLLLKYYTQERLPPHCHWRAIQKLWVLAGYPTVKILLPRKPKMSVKITRAASWLQQR